MSKLSEISHGVFYERFLSFSLILKPVVVLNFESRKLFPVLNWLRYWHSIILSQSYIWQLTAIANWCPLWARWAFCISTTLIKLSFRNYSWHIICSWASPYSAVLGRLSVGCSSHYLTLFREKKIVIIENGILEYKSKEREIKGRSSILRSDLRLRHGDSLSLVLNHVIT